MAQHRFCAATELDERHRFTINCQLRASTSRRHAGMSRAAHASCQVTGKHHPDKSGCPKKFKSIAHAYEVLSDPERRKLYDQFGDDSFKPNFSPHPPPDGFQHLFGGGFHNGNPGGFPGFFATAAGGGNATPDIFHPLRVSLDDIFRGKTFRMCVNRNIVCRSCDGTGAPPGQARKCVGCAGMGVQRSMRGIAPGLMQRMQRMCPICSGKGVCVDSDNKCEQCAGARVIADKQTIDVHMPAATIEDDSLDMDNGYLTSAAEFDEAIDAFMSECSENDLLVDDDVDAEAAAEAAAAHNANGANTRGMMDAAVDLTTYVHPYEAHAFKDAVTLAQQTGDFTRGGGNLESAVAIVSSAARAALGADARVTVAGSVAKGTTVMGSDVDLYVETSKPVTLQQRQALEARLRQHPLTNAAHVQLKLKAIHMQLLGMDIDVVCANTVEYGELPAADASVGAHAALQLAVQALKIWARCATGGARKVPGRMMEALAKHCRDARGSSISSSSQQGDGGMQLFVAVLQAPLVHTHAEVAPGWLFMAPAQQRATDAFFADFGGAATAKDRAASRTAASSSEEWTAHDGTRIESLRLMLDSPLGVYTTAHMQAPAPGALTVDTVMTEITTLNQHAMRGSKVASNMLLARMMWVDGDLALRDGRADEAVELYAASLRASVADGDPFCGWWRADSKYAECADSVLARHPNGVDAHMLHAWSFMRSDRCKDSERVLTATIERHAPDDTHGVIHLRMCLYGNQGRWVEALQDASRSTRGAVELDGSGAREQPRWTAATAAAHQPDALAKELRDFNQVYGSFVSEHPHPTDVPDYRLVPPASVTSGCMVSTWEPRDELDCCASFTDDDEVLCTAYERVVWTAAGVHPDSGRVTLVCGGGAGRNGEVRPNKDFEAADWKEAWITGEVSPWAPQVGEVVLYYSSSCADEKAMPSIAQVIGHAEPVSHPFSKVTDMVRIWHPRLGREVEIPAWQLAPCWLPRDTHLLARCGLPGVTTGEITMLVEMECSFDGQARLRDIRDGCGKVLVSPIIDGKRQPTVMLAWHKLQPLGRSVSSFCTLPPDRALTDSYVMAPTDVEEWARPLVYASSPSLLDCAYTPNTSSPLRAWLSSDGYRVSSHRPKNGLQGFQMQPSVLQRSSCAGHAPAVPGGQTRSQCSRVVDGAAGMPLRVPMCSVVQNCSETGDSSVHVSRTALFNSSKHASASGDHFDGINEQVRLRADGDHARAITGGASSTAVASEGGSDNRGTTPTTRNCDIASTVIGGDAAAAHKRVRSALVGMVLSCMSMAVVALATRGRRVLQRQLLQRQQRRVFWPERRRRHVFQPQCRRVQLQRKQMQWRLLRSTGSEGWNLLEERPHQVPSRLQNAWLPLQVSGSDVAELQSLSHVAIGEGIILAGLPVPQVADGSSRGRWEDRTPVGSGACAACERGSDARNPQAISNVGVSAPPLVKGVDGSAQGSGTTSLPTTLCEPALGAPQRHMPQAEVMSTAAQAGVTAAQAGASGAVAKRRSQGNDTAFAEVALQSAGPQGKDTEFAAVAHQSGTLSPALVSLSLPAETSAGTAGTGSAPGILSAGALALFSATRTSDAGTGLQSRSHAAVEGDSTLGIVVSARLEFDVGSSARGSATLTAGWHGSTSPSSARAGVCNSGAPGQVQTTGVLVGCSLRLNIAMATAGPNGCAPDAAVLPEDRGSSAQCSAGVADAACEISSMSRSPLQGVDGSVLQQLSESLINSSAGSARRSTPPAEGHGSIPLSTCSEQHTGSTDPPGGYGRRTMQLISKPPVHCSTAQSSMQFLDTVGGHGSNVLSMAPQIAGQCPWSSASEASCDGNLSDFTSTDRSDDGSAGVSTQLSAGHHSSGQDTQSAPSMSPVGGGNRCEQCSMLRTDEVGSGNEGCVLVGGGGASLNDEALGHEAAAPTAARPTAARPMAGNSITDNVVQSACSSSGNGGTTHSSAPLCRGEVRVQPCSAKGAGAASPLLDRPFGTTQQSTPLLDTHGGNTQGLVHLSGFAGGPPRSGQSSTLSYALDGGGAPGLTQCSDVPDGQGGSVPDTTPLTIDERGGHAQSSETPTDPCSRALRPASFSLINGVDDTAQSFLQCANVIGGRRDATHSTAAFSDGQGHDTQVLAMAVGAAGELGVQRRKVGPFAGPDESSTVPTQGLAQTAGIADGDIMAHSSTQLPGHIRNARSSAVTIGANIQRSVPRTEGISSSAHGFAQHADAGGGNGDGVRGLALPPAGDTGTGSSTQYVTGDGGGRDAISPSRSSTVPSAGSSITDGTAHSAVRSGGRHDTAHGSAPLCDGHGRVIQVCTCAAVDGVAERCDCHTQTLSSELPMENGGSNAQGLAKSAGASGNHGDGTCSSGPLSTQGFAQSAVDGGDGGVGTHSSVPLSVLLDGGTHDSGVISTAHGFALTSGVTGAGQCSSFYSAQSLVSQSGTASNGTANATTLSLVGDHANNLQGSHAAQVVAGHDGSMQPMGMGSGPTKGVEQSRMGGCSTLLLEAASNAVQDLHTGALLEQQAISSHPPSRPGCCVGTLSSSLSSVGGGDISSDDTAASAGTGNGDFLLQQRACTALQYQRPQLSNKAAGTTYAIGYHSGHLLRQQQWLVAAGHSGGDTAACVSDSGGTSRAALDISQTAQLGLRTGKLLPHQAHKALRQQRSALPHQQQASAMQQLRSTPVQRLSPAQHKHQRQLLLAAPQPQQCSVLTGGTCFHQALCPKVQRTGSPTPTHMGAGPRTEEAALVPANGIDDASVPFDPGICSKVYATVPAAMGVSSKPPATRISDSLSRDAGLNGQVQLPSLPLTVQRCTECRTVGLLSSTSNTETGVASCHSREGSASFGGVGGICGILAPLSAAPNSHDPITVVLLSNMVIATASPARVYSNEGGAAVSISTSNGHHSIAGSPSAVECTMEAVQLVAVATAGACRLAEAVRRKAMVLVQQGTARAGITTSAQCATLVPAQHSPMAGRTAMTTRSIDPGEVAARNNGSYTGHTSGEGEAHTAGSCDAICNGGGKAYSYAVLRDDEVRTHDVVMPRSRENDVQPMAHTAGLRRKAHGDVVARGFEDKEPNATGEVGGSSGVQTVPRRAMMRTPVYASRARARATVATEEVVVSSNRAHVRRWRLTADLKMRLVGALYLKVPIGTTKRTWAQGLADMVVPQVGAAVLKAIFAQPALLELARRRPDLGSPIQDLQTAEAELNLLNSGAIKGVDLNEDVPPADGMDGVHPFDQVPLMADQPYSRQRFALVAATDLQGPVKNAGWATCTLKIRAGALASGLFFVEGSNTMLAKFGAASGAGIDFAASPTSTVSVPIFFSRANAIIPKGAVVAWLPPFCKDENTRRQRRFGQHRSDARNNSRKHRQQQQHDEHRHRH
ncbi:hypothetical protein JKP88DRAFT_255842 [Tribonema minus]|uniref:Uncharacterized protein n=1 Tax=Tribonema minus TaxID=303371 RepID=A0A836CEC5_9STRA|nr:hypothetical protein JKP88DRAFT_255842 [Tribonema minus]